MITCRQCNTPFEVTEADREFYKKIEVPEPTLCPQCRLQRRLSFRNERSLYKRTCDLCKKGVISFYDADAPYTVYCRDCWWGDGWDPKSYGKEYDPSRPFMEQLAELIRVVPKAAALQMGCENSEYNAYLYFSKNTYLSPGSYFVEDCLFCRKSQYSKDCVSSNALNKCELIAESTNCDNCYQGHHLINCRNCSSSAYLNGCTGVENCFMCSGISNKKYWFKNTPYSKEEYEKIVGDYSQKNPEMVLKEFKDFLLTVPHRALNQINCEDSTGDYLQNCKNAVDSYDCFEVQDSRYMCECVKVKDCMDISMHDEDVSYCYELCTGGKSSYFTKFSYCSVDSPYSEYTYSCMYLTNGFGCDGVHTRSKFMILNKEYSEEEYKILRAKIIEDMKKEENPEYRYGEFFPFSMSNFIYNETLAQDYFPITEETARSYNIPWKVRPTPPYSTDPEVRTCVTCAKQFKIITQERDLYKKIGLPEATECPECRYLKIISWKNPRQLWTRACSNCTTEIRTTYHPSRPEIVYCERCYLETVK